jgi:hypothetical protein
VSSVEHELFAMLRELAGEVEGRVPVVRLTLDDGECLEVFRAEQVRERPIAWRIRGFDGGNPQRELVALVLGTLDGRATVMRALAEGATAGGSTVVSAEPSSRRIADLAELIARRVRERFGDA